MADPKYIYGGQVYGNLDSRTNLAYNQDVHVGSADDEHPGSGTLINIKPKGGDNLYVYDGGLIVSSFLQGSFSSELSAGVCSRTQVSAYVYDGGMLSGNMLEQNFDAAVYSGGQILDSEITGTNKFWLYGGLVSGISGSLGNSGRSIFFNIENGGQLMTVSELENLRINISSGGYSEEIAIGSGGSMTISSGGSAADIAIASGAKMVVGTAAFASGVDIASGGSLTISGGSPRGSAYDVNADSGSYLEVRGVVSNGANTHIDADTTVMGIVYLESGATATNLELRSAGGASGTLYVSGGAIVHDTLIKPGTMYVNGGSAFNTEAQMFGRILVSGGGYASGVFLNVGTGYSGSVATSSGGATLTVQSGGKVEYVMVSDLSTASVTGGEISNITISSGGTLSVSPGTAEHISLESGAILTVGNNAVIGDLVMSPGIVPGVASSGGVILDKRVTLNGVIFDNCEFTKFYSSGAVLNDVVFDGTQFDIARGVVVSGLVVRDADGVIREAVSSPTPVSAYNVVVSAGGYLQVAGVELLLPTVASTMELPQDGTISKERLLELVDCLEERGMLADTEAIDCSEADILVLRYAGRFDVEIPYDSDFDKKLYFLEQIVDRLEENERGTVILTMPDKGSFKPAR